MKIAFTHEWVGKTLKSQGVVTGQEPWNYVDFFGVIEGSSKQQVEARSEKAIAKLFDAHLDCNATVLVQT